MLGRTICSELVIPYHIIPYLHLHEPTFSHCIAAISHFALHIPLPPTSAIPGRTLYPVTPTGSSFVEAYDFSVVHLTWLPPNVGPAPSTFAALSRCGAQPALQRLPGDFSGLTAVVAPPGLAAGAVCYFAVRSRNLNYDPTVPDWALAPGGNSVTSAEYPEVMYGAQCARPAARAQEMTGV